MIDPKFRRVVQEKSVAELKRQFAGEARSHASMLERHRKGKAQVNADLRPFRNFLIAVGPQPEPSYTIDRIDTYDLEYAAGNVRWASKREQSNNRRNTTLLRGEDGDVLPLSDWARRTGQDAATLRQRKKRGWTDLEIISGRRLGRGPQAPTSAPATGSWPDGVRVSDWEPHYRDWLKARGRPLPEDTRSVFYAWIEQSAIRGLEDQLAAVFPDTFGSEASPDARGDPEIENHPLYGHYHDRFARLQCVLRSLSPMERASLQRLKRRRVSDPRTAAGSEQGERSQYR
jgi:hypothetical protein